MSEERKPTAPSAGNGAAPIVCTTIRLAPEAIKANSTQPVTRSAEDFERTEIPPEKP
jgi:hypothetical protein